MGGGRDIHAWYLPVAQGVRRAFIFMQPDAAELAEMARLVDGGKLKAMVETRCLWQMPAAPDN